MIKYIVLLFNMLGLLVYQALFTDGVTITQTAPSSVAAGSEFTVELTVNKGNIGGFAKLQQDLPAGFTATVIEAKGASFTFSNQSAKFIWTALPGDASFRISYKVTVAAGTTGDKILAGKFSYIESNAKKTADITPITVTIGGTPVANNNEGNNPSTNNNTTGDTGNTAANNTDNTGNDSSGDNNTNTGSSSTTDNSANKTAGDNTSEENLINGVSCVRTIPAETEGGDFKVEIVIKKGNLSGFAKLQETLPAGFTATGGNNNGASFSFSDQKVKLVWVALPADAEFKVSYNVKVDKAVAGSGPKSITGLFSYIENDETRKFNIPASVIDVKDGGPLANNNTSNTTNNNGQSNDNTSAGNTGNQKQTDPANNTGNTGNSIANNNTGNNNPANNTAANNTSNGNSNGNGNGNTNTSVSTGVNIPSPQAGVLYRVQLAALQNPKSASWFNSKYGINGQVYTEMHEGFTKYTTGSFPVYKSARDERENIRTRGVEGPFVTAYNNGKRITVQEAIMITSQQWYR